MKKKIKILIISIFISSCAKTKHKNHLTISGKIDHKICDSIVVKSFYKKKTSVIRLAPNGSFKDTLKVVDGYYSGLYIGDFFTKAYFQNGDDIKIFADLDNFDNTLKISGKGAEETNFILKFHNTLRIMHEEDHIHDLPEVDFSTKLNNHFSKLNTILLNDKALDNTFIIKMEKEITHVKKNIEKSYKQKMYIKSQLDRGKPSPKFYNYDNYKGGTTSLDDLKGNYVYIDFWDTSCKPCIAEFPALEKLIKKYNNKNIKFVSIALMNKEAQEWKTYVLEKKLKGIQLLNSKNDNFRKAYKVFSTPRYLLIDPEGDIVNSDAPKPSDMRLIKLFDKLGI